mmetsp:Transcript_10760/g.30781  ORF Transcript_10760/g.30781 Transcript_10760/m.30781 type:complete len:206 (-) Transcript_10760:38-655(-)
MAELVYANAPTATPSPDEGSVPAVRFNVVGFEASRSVEVVEALVAVLFDKRFSMDLLPLLLRALRLARFSRCCIIAWSDPTPTEARGGPAAAGATAAIFASPPSSSSSGPVRFARGFRSTSRLRSDLGLAAALAARDAATAPEAGTGAAAAAVGTLAPPWRREPGWEGPREIRRVGGSAGAALSSSSSSIRRRLSAMVVLLLLRR